METLLQAAANAAKAATQCSYICYHLRDDFERRDLWEYDLDMETILKYAPIVE